MNILIFGICSNDTMALNSIFKNLYLTDSRFLDLNVTCVSFNDKENDYFMFDKVRVINIPSPFLKVSFYRLVRRFNYIFKLDNPILGYKWLLKKLSCKLSFQSFDYIVGVSGIFLYMQAAFVIGQKYHKPFLMFYFDPFVNNVSTKNIKARNNLENKWFCLSKKIFFNKENDEPKNYCEKCVPFLIPIFEKKHFIAKNNNIVYAGGFYNGFRSFESLKDFLNYYSLSKFNFVFYSNILTTNLPNKNLELHAYVSPNELDDILSSCKAIIVLGNSTLTNTVPSKILEALSFKKPIIGFNFVSSNNVLDRYPYFYDLSFSFKSFNFEVLNNILEQDLNSVCLYRIYPERDPKIIINIIFDVLNEQSEN